MTDSSIGAVDLVASAVTVLFVPGDRPDRYGKAANSGADAIIIDLEDAVAPTAKDEARQSVIQALNPTNPESVHALVRVNAAGSDTYETEIQAIAELAALPESGLLGIVLPKAEDPGVIAELVRRLRAVHADLAVVPIIESARGVLAAADIARVPGITRLALGAIDLTVDTDADLESPIVTHAMAQLVLTSRAARTAPPLDSPATVINNPDAIGATARAARSTGFGGKLCIHPAQLEPVRTAFQPTQNQINWARTVIDAGDTAVQIAGQMIDKPVIDKARRILQRAGQENS